MKLVNAAQRTLLALLLLQCLVNHQATDMLVYRMSLIETLIVHSN
jgi:Trp operon repressor